MVNYMEKYSVLMSVYSGEKPEYLRDSIESILAQTVKPDQFVIVEDGELTTDAENIIKKYENERKDLFTIVRNKNNQGLGIALDCGIQYCRNELIARMDSDDIAFPDRCRKELEVFARDNSIDIVSGSIAEFEGSISNIVSHRVVPEHNKEICKQMRRRSPFNHPAVMYKKSKVIECGGYGGSARKEDHDLFSRMLHSGCQGYNLQEDILYYRTGADGIRRRQSWKNISSYFEIMWINLKRGYCGIDDFLIVSVELLFYAIAPTSIVKKILNTFFRS